MHLQKGVAFSAAKGMDFGWCRGPEKGLPEPDVVIWLELSIEEAKVCSMISCDALFVEDSWFRNVETTVWKGMKERSFRDQFALPTKSSRSRFG